LVPWGFVEAGEAAGEFAGVDCEAGLEVTTGIACAPGVCGTQPTIKASISARDKSKSERGVGFIFSTVNPF
jgi:hypothetical protein